MSEVLDTTLNIETPEGVELLLPVAGIAPRSLAWLIDSMIKIGIIFVAANILAAIENVGEGLRLLTMFGVIWGYNVLFEALMQGATPGKKIVGVHVMNADGTPIGWRGATLRNLLRPVDVFPGCYLFGCLSVLFTRNFQRLGDLAAGTVVVHRQEVPAKNPWDDVDPQPTLCHVKFASLLSDLLDHRFCLFLSADKQNRFMLCNYIDDNLTRIAYLLQSFGQIDDVNPISLFQNKAAHFGIPTPFLMSEVSARLEQFLNGNTCLF